MASLPTQWQELVFLWLSVLLPHKCGVCIALGFTFLLSCSLGLQWYRIRKQGNQKTTSECKQGKFVLLTGASRGIGREIAINLANRGFNLILVARSEKELHDLQNEIQDIENAVDVHVVPWDLSMPHAAESLYIELVKNSLGKIDILCNAAGLGLRAPLEAMRKEQISEMLHVNVLGCSVIPVTDGKQCFLNVALVVDSIAIVSMRCCCLSKSVYFV